MRLHPGLFLVVGLAVAWAASVFGLYFLAINWIPPINNWGLSDQIQLFQAFVGLAGFGGGLIALFFAEQQLAHLFADPKLVVTYRAEGRDPLTGGEVTGMRTGSEGDAARLDLLLEITNRSESICELWQVAVPAPPGAQVVGGDGWKTSPAGEQASYQAGPKEALYPHSPYPLGAVVILFLPESLAGDVSGERLWSGRLTTRITTQRRTREQRLDIRLLVPPAEKASGDDMLGAWRDDWLEGPPATD